VAAINTAPFASTECVVVSGVKKGAIPSMNMPMASRVHANFGAEECGGARRLHYHL
jgi:hypothetical protein